MGEFGNYYRTRLLGISNVATPTIFNYLQVYWGTMNYGKRKVVLVFQLCYFPQKTLEFFQEGKKEDNH